MLKFCCNKFEIFHRSENFMGLNIRVIELSKEMVQRAKLSEGISIMITEGYNGKIEDCQKKVAINYCPFCGNNLKYIRKNIDYIHEKMELV